MNKMMRYGVTSLMAAGLISHTLPGWSAEARTPQNDPALRARTKWWRDARFGMFVHWGLYAVPAGYYRGQPVGGFGGEWIMDAAKIPIAEYEKYAAQFNPVEFNAREWARTAKAAGMKYLVFTSKHHEGFSMFDTAVNRYDIVDATPYRKDPVKDLAQACRAEGIKLAFYYSIVDWHRPELMGNDVKPEDVDRYVNGQMKPQLRELITKYDPALFWFDGEFVNWWSEERGRDLERYLRSLKSDLIINNRIGKKTIRDGDYETPEQEIPANSLASGRLWETCMTMNDTWGFQRSDNNWKSTSDLTRKLIDIASKGGNFLLNVGPTAEGVIPEPSMERLREMGQWMKQNGEAIYGTEKSPYRRHPFDGRCTVKGNTLYIHAFTWPSEGLHLPGLKTTIRGARVLGSGEKVDISSSTSPGEPKGVTLRRPSRLDPIATVIAVRLEGVPQVEEPPFVVRTNAQGGINLKAIDAEVHGKSAVLEGGGDQAHIGAWMNAADYVTWNAQVDRPGTYRVEVEYAVAPDSAGAAYSVQAERTPEVKPNSGTPISAASATSVNGTVSSTGGWGNFRTESIGTMRLESGRQKVTVRANSKPGLAVMNFRRVLLTPVQQ